MVSARLPLSTGVEAHGDLCAGPKGRTAGATTRAPGWAWPVVSLLRCWEQVAFWFDLQPLLQMTLCLLPSQVQSLPVSSAWSSS